MQLLLLKLAALAAFCGGPLLVADWLKPHLGQGPAFGIGLAPLAVLLFGTLSLDDPDDDRFGRLSVRAGALGALGLLAMNGLGAVWLLTGHVQDPVLSGFGLLIGTTAALYYLSRMLHPPARDPLAGAAKQDPDHRSKPSVDDWGLVAIGLGFVVAGLVVLPRKPQVGIVTIVFFGACAAVGLGTLRRKRGHRRAGPPVPIPFGVPIRKSAGRAATLGAGLGALGATLTFAASDYPVLLRALGALIGVVGAVLLAGVLLGHVPVGHLELTPAGLLLGRRSFSYTVPWDAVASVSMGELHSNPVALIAVVDRDRVIATTAEDRARAHKELLSNQRWLGVDLVIMTSQYNLDLPSFVERLQRLAAESAPSTRLRR